MNIAMISEHASPLAALGGVDAGGQNVHVAALSRALADRGHSVTVYTRRDDPELADRVSVEPGVDVVHVTAGPPASIPKDELLPHMAEFAARLADAWTGNAPDVVHGHFWMSGVAALDAVRALSNHRTRPAVLATFHALGTVKRRFQGSADTSPVERQWLEPMIGRRADAVIATCPDEVAELQDMGVPRVRINVVPCGVDTELFTPNVTPERLGRTHRLVSIGRLVPRKGVENIIEALALLQHEHGMRDIELEVVGGGADGSAIESDRDVRRLAALARQLNVIDQVHFRGQLPQRQIPSLIRSADAVVCTPWYEPFGIVPLESMACGVPVVVSAVGGLADSVVDNVTGKHVPPHDPPALASALSMLLADPELREAQGAAGRQRVESHYTWKHIAERTEAVYREARTRALGTAPQFEEVAL